MSARTLAVVTAGLGQPSSTQLLAERITAAAVAHLEEDGIEARVQIVDLPVVIGATAGTARHSLALDYAIRPLFTYLHSVVVPTAVFAASEDWGSGADAVKTLSDRIERAAREFVPLVAASERSSQVRDPFLLATTLSPVGGFQAEQGQGHPPRKKCVSNIHKVVKSAYCRGYDNSD